MKNLLAECKKYRQDPSTNPMRVMAREVWSLTHDFKEIAVAREHLLAELEASANGDEAGARWAIGIFDQVILALRERAQAARAERIIAKHPRRTLKEWVEGLDTY